MGLRHRIGPGRRALEVNFTVVNRLDARTTIDYGSGIRFYIRIRREKFCPILTGPGFIIFLLKKGHTLKLTRGQMNKIISLHFV